MRSYGKNFLLAGANLRRTKGQITAISMLVLLSASLLNLWLMLKMDYRQNFQRCHDRLNAEHVTIAVDGDSDEMREFLARTLTGDARTDVFFMDWSMHMVGTFEYNGGKVNEEMIFLEKQSALSRPVGRVEIVEEGGSGSGVYLPLLYKSEKIAVGKTIEIIIGSVSRTYEVCGFFNSAMAGSHNCSMSEVLLTADKYGELEEAGCAPKSLLCSVRLWDRTESESFEAMLKDAIATRYPAARTVSNSYTLVSQSRYISQMICAGILSTMAFFILLIALIVMASNIVNYIGENMRDLGVLKAVGYTSGQLIGSLLTQFLGISLIAAAVGAGISYALFPFLNVMMTAQTGIPYQIRFLPLPFLYTLLILNGAAALTVCAASRRIRKVDPIVALRQGVRTHHFRRNHVPLEKTKAPLSLALALKTTLSGARHNITVCVTMCVLSLIAVFSGVMVENVIADITPFLNMIVGEVADSCINVNVEAEEAFLQMMRDEACVEKSYLYNTEMVRHAGGVELAATISEDFSMANNQRVVFEGRFPKYENEIAIGKKYAKEKGLKVGDEIVISADGKSAEYLISGFTQVSNYLGKDCLLTREGYERIGRQLHVSYYLNLSDGTDVEAFHGRVKERFGSEVNAVINIMETVEGVGGVYVTLITIIVAVVLALSAIVIAFVLFLLVRTLLTSKKRDYGILKALGCTTGQLILQTALSFLPAVTLSTVLGIGVSCAVINPLMSLFLSGIGIVKCTFAVPVGFVAAAGVLLVLASFAIACLMSLKIRKIAPRFLLVGE